MEGTDASDRSHATVYHDKAKGRHFVEKRVPPDVHAIIGGKAKRKHTFPKSVDEATPNRLALAILDGWEQEWEAARPIQLVPVRFSRPRPPGIVLDAIMMEGIAGISRDELMRRLVNAYRPRMIRLPLAIGAFDDNAHAVAAVLVVGVTEHADARPLHFDNCRDALAIAEPQHRHLGLTRDGVAIQRHHLEYMLRQSEAADFAGAGIENVQEQSLAGLDSDRLAVAQQAAVDREKIIRQFVTLATFRRSNTSAMPDLPPREGSAV